MQTAEREIVDKIRNLETKSFSSDLKSEIDSRLTSNPQTENRTNRFFYSVGAFNILLEQDIKVENLSNLTINVIPHTPEWCDGIVNVRGIIMPIVNMHSFLKTGSQNTSKKTELIMLDHKEHTPIIFRIDKLPKMVFLDEYSFSDAPLKSPNWLLKSLKNGTNTLYEVNHSELMQQLKNSQI